MKRRGPLTLGNFEDIQADCYSIATQVPHQAPSSSRSNTPHKRQKIWHLDFDDEEVSIDHALSRRQPLPTTSPLLDLPRELRDMVWLFALQGISVIFRQHTSIVVAGFGDLDDTEHAYAMPHWSNACRELRHEATERLHDRATFTIGYGTSNLLPDRFSTRTFSSAHPQPLPLKLEHARNWRILNARAKQDLGYWDQTNIAFIRLPSKEDVLTLDVALQSPCRVQDIQVAIEEGYPDYLYQWRVTKFDFPFLTRVSTNELRRVRISFPVLHPRSDRHIGLVVQMLQHAMSAVGKKGEIPTFKICGRKEYNAKHETWENIWQCEVTSAAYRRACQL
ncbi:hypothetical protein BDV96DRAFT_652584 [Lophiotrema nucula]|uniref:Uncharacterized protein n=1 Tax=Lophiotrema nucula TaxID=690887 RepID=A0A6A5YNX4_9PLEO|nr:hypothetical protein BDV96DRAFT_652584 [Lophiotrema nucula]